MSLIHVLESAVCLPILFVLAPMVAIQSYLSPPSDVPATTQPESSCQDFELRLTNTSFTSQDVYLVYEGNVEACIDGTFISICDLGWNDVDAQVACNAMGYGEPYYRKICAWRDWL